MGPIAPLRRRRILALAVLLVFCGGGVVAGGPPSRSRVGIVVPSPAGFTAAPNAVARRSAQPLLELLAAGGLKPLGITRARLSLMGSPGDPHVTLLTAQVRVLTDAPSATPLLDEVGLAAMLARSLRDTEGAVRVGPGVRSAAGLAGHELGWTLPLEGGRARMLRHLLLPTPGSVLVLTLDVQSGDEKEWSAAWARLVRTLAPEVPPQESGLPLFPALPLVLAAAALLTATVQSLRRGAEPLPSEAFVARMESLGRAPRTPYAAASSASEGCDGVDQNLLERRLARRRKSHDL